MHSIGVAILYDPKSCPHPTISPGLGWMASSLLDSPIVFLARRTRCVSPSDITTFRGAYPGTVLGVTAVALLHPTAPLFNNTEATSPGLKFFLAALATNFALNIFVTLNIVIRLLLHRRYAIVAFGRKSTMAEQPLHISNIFLESAAINLPLALFSIVGLVRHAMFTELLAQIIIPGQVCGSSIYEFFLHIIWLFHGSQCIASVMKYLFYDTIMFSIYSFMFLLYSCTLFLPSPSYLMSLASLDIAVLNLIRLLHKLMRNQYWLMRTPIMVTTLDSWSIFMTYVSYDLYWLILTHVAC